MSRFILNLKKIVAELELIELNITQELEANSKTRKRLYKKYWEEEDLKVKETGIPLTEEEFMEIDMAISLLCEGYLSIKNIFIKKDKVDELNDLIAKEIEYLIQSTLTR